MLRRAAPHWAVSVVATQVLANGLNAWCLLLTARLLGQLLSAGADSSRLRAALPMLLLLFAVHSLRLLFEAMTAMARSHLAPRVRRQAEEDLLQASLAVELAAFDDAAFHDQLLRARDRGIQNLQEVTLYVVDAIGSGLAVISTGTALCLLHPLLAVILLIALLPEAWASMNTARIRYQRMPVTISLYRQASMMADLATERASAAEVRANQAQQYLLDEHRRSATLLQEHEVSIGLAQARAMAIGRTLSGIGLAGTFTVLALMLYGHWLTLAVAGTAVYAIRSTAAALTRFVQLNYEIFEKSLYVSDFSDFIGRAKPAAPAGGVASVRQDPQRIELRDVSFRYSGQSAAFALRDISLTLHAGQTIALVGENGSGKTTLAKLIAGLYRPTTGCITWDGVDLRTLAPDQLADRIVMVLQDPVRWPRSARDNIRLGRHDRLDPDDRWLLHSARQAQALDVIQRLPRGWDTLLTSEFRGGQDLSGGQWQRLAVARGLYRDAPLLIWDEPTAPLDAKAEHAVFESLRKLARNRTVVLITHRLASVRNADRIYFLEQGRLAEQGRHEDLLRSGGRYAELYELQSRLHGLGNYGDGLPEAEVANRSTTGPA